MADDARVMGYFEKKLDKRIEKKVEEIKENDNKNHQKWLDHVARMERHSEQVERYLSEMNRLITLLGERK